ncbi:DUF2062 domain-containing protein [Thioalkalivibrio sulfidiphilus]|uniref:DUF2062 domain-containing protein n=1 Tax=Thioalkalivibrio sulfidiphilus (strain HL-EbGR7) TaxID=396588 RepID=B8GR32_THISH|nr:DUF2062 domain-containing protein [Thioalkalivibrio sulfidiphilus]ACL72452.1 conserved hypothetical protein [Thioalkalivibrio sulfidiphilus HL-EbGr7]
MAKKIIKRLFPSYHRVRDHQSLRFLGTLLHDPNLWHMNRRSVAGAFAVGLFIALLPLPFQMIISALIAIMIRVNLPISVLLVWITNPLTMGPIYYTAYTIGRKVLDLPRVGFSFELSLQWFTQELLIIWKPLLLGSLIMATVAAIAGYVAVRVLWRLHILSRINWRRRGKKVEG